MNELHFYELGTDTAENGGVKVTVCDYGATLAALRVPDRDGVYADVVLGYDTPEGYVSGKAFHGGTIGRYANRICGASYSHKEKTHRLTANDGYNTLHGGGGFHTKVWTVQSQSDTAIVFGYTSPDGEDGFPCELAVTTAYELTAPDTLTITYTASNNGGAAAATPVSITNHAYYNLSGGVRDVRDTQLHLRAAEYTPLDCEGIPIGTIQSVRTTQYDFTAPRAIADEYDNNFILNQRDCKADYAARAYDPHTGRIMSLYTNLPAAQLYTGIHLNETGRNGVSYGAFGGFCVEPQYTPDTPNLVNKTSKFPSCMVKNGETRTDFIKLNFSVK